MTDGPKCYDCDAPLGGLLTMKMQQVMRLNKRIDYIRDIVGVFSTMEPIITTEQLEEMDGYLEGKHWREGIAEGERRMAMQILDILNKADGYDD